MVDVNRFFAAAASFSNQDFLSGVDHFTAVSGLVANSGQIRANQVSLIGSQVINQGSIVAPGGIVAMLAGSDVLVSEQGSHITAKVVPATSAAPASAGSTQAGPSTVDIRTSALAAGDVYSLAIRHTGYIRAGNVLINGGQGQVQVSGSIDASTSTPGAIGGNVAITGGQVDLASADVNVSGPAGGGTVQIGGGPHGGGDLPQAQNVSADSTTTIDADATSNGPGGSIVLWSDGTTSVAAALTARGGPIGGNGGYIETSGDDLQVSTAPNASAPHGNAGTWVMDPIDITIESGTGTGTFTGPTVFNQDIDAALNGGTNVVIDTSNQTNGSDVGTLTQNPDAIISVTPTSNNVTLTLRANSDMILQGGITSSGSFTLSVELDQLNSTGSAVTVETTPININGSFTVVGGNFTLASGIGLAASGITMGSGTVIADSGSVPVTMGSITISGPVSTTAGAFTAGGNTSFITNGTGSITTTGGGVSITNSGALITFGAAVVTNGGDFSMTNGGSFSNSGSGTITTGGGNVTLTCSEDCSVSAEINTGGGSLTVNSPTFESSAEITDGVTTGSQSVSITTTTTTSSLGLTMGGPITWAGTDGVTLQSATFLTMSGSISSAGSGTVPVSLLTSSSTADNSITGAVNASGPFLANGGLVILATTGSVTAQSVGLNTTTTGTVTVSGPVTTTAGAFTAGGTTSFISNGTGDITTTGGGVTITNSGALITLGEPIVTNGGAFSMTNGGSFSTSGNGTISTGGGNVTLTCSEDCSVSAEINTGGGSLTVSSPTFESSAEITDGVTTGSQSLSITTTTTTATSGLTMGGPVTWAGTGGTTLQSKTFLTMSGSISSAGSGTVPVSLLTSSSTADNSITGAVNASGPFLANGGLVILATTGSVTAQSVGLNTTTTGTVTVSGPVTTTAGAFTAGGTTSFISNGTGDITTTGGGVTITNSGALITLGEPIVTNGGAFSMTNGGSFSTSGNGTISTGGGNVTLTCSEDCSVSAEINTGGGSLTVSSPTFESSAEITDGVTTGSQSLSITTTTTSATSGLTMGGPVTWAGTGGVTLESATFVTMTGSINSAGSGTVPVSQFTTSSAGDNDISGTVVTSGAFIASGGLVTIDTTASVTAQSVALNNNATDFIGDTLTLGTVTISGPVVTNGGNLIVGGTTYFFANQNGTITTNGGAVQITNNGANVGIGAAVNTGGGAFTTTEGGTFTNSGNGTIDTGGGAVTITCSTDCSVGAEINTGGGSFTVNSPTFETNAEITDGVTTGTQLLSITTTNTDPNNTSVAETLIDLNILGDIDWAGGMTFSVPSGFYLGLSANITATVGGPIDLTGVTLDLTGTSSTISGGNISFGSIINTDNTTTPDLNVVSYATVRLGAVGSSSIPIGSLFVSNSGTGPEPTIVLNGDIYVTGDAAFSGTVSLATNIYISDINQESGDSGDVEFDGPLEGPGGLTADDVTQTRINSSVGNVTPVAYLNFIPGAGGFVFFNAGPAGSSGADLPSSPQGPTVVNIAAGGYFEVNYGGSSPREFYDLYATIDSYGALTVNIGSASSPNSSNLFGVGQYEKLTALGDLAINADGGTAVIGDLSADGNISINAANIEFVLRGPTIAGTADLDKGMDLIANGEISLPANAHYSTIAPSQPAAFDVPGFVARSFNPSSNIAAIAASLNTAISVIQSVAPSAFFSPYNLLLDLTPATLGGVIPTFVAPIPFVFDYPFAGAVPRQQLVAATVPADFKLAFQTGYPGPVLQQDLKDDGVYTREPTLDEILAATSGPVDYDDLPKKRRPHAWDFSVVATRMNTPPAREFLAGYQAFFGGSGNSPQTANRRSRIAAEIQTAWDAYVSQNGYNAETGAGFQQYCARTPAAAKVAADLVQLNGLFQQLRLLGLSQKEASEAFQYNILAGLSANGMQDRDLTNAVENAGPAQ